MFIQYKMVNVIVADDIDSWREMYIDILQEAFPNVSVDAVSNGSDLVARVLLGNYSVVISDNDMEKPNAGLEALRTLRTSGNNVPFYLLSGKSIREKVLQAGANEFYNKENFDADKIMKDIARYIE